MKRNKKNLICLSTALALAFSVSALSPAAYAAIRKSPKKANSNYSQNRDTSKKKFQKQNGTKNILIIEDKTKTKGITYPDYFPNDKAITYPEILSENDIKKTVKDKGDAQDYLLDALSKIREYDLDKNTIDSENTKEFPFAGEVKEWYFGYGPKKQGNLLPSKYFAVNADGEIFEYNTQQNRWFLLAVAY